MAPDKHDWINLLELEQLARPTIKKMVSTRRDCSFLACREHAACRSLPSIRLSTVLRFTTVLDQVDGFYSSGAESQSTLKANREAYSHYRLIPRCMVDVSDIDMTYTLLGARTTLSESSLSALDVGYQMRSLSSGHSACCRAEAVMPLLDCSYGTTMSRPC